MEKDAVKEYKKFVSKYLMPLLGVSQERNLIDISDLSQEHKQNAVFYQENGHLYFCSNKKPLFKMEYNRTLSTDDINLAINIIQSFFKVSPNRIDGKGKNISYYSDSHKKANYELAIQKGICNWIVGSDNPDVENLLDALTKWSVQTYEGKKVTLGCIINPHATHQFNDNYGTFLDFISDDIAAVFTDCVNSVFELDAKCRFCRYISITENNVIESLSLTHYLPIRFANVIQNYVKGNSVGIFLLNNGDIILSKQGQIRFVKRNLKWLNFSYEAFKNAFGTFLDDNNIHEELIQNIYASTLDVSFSHTGGIISVVTEMDNLTIDENDKYPILNITDNLLNSISLDKLNETLKGSIKQKELSKRLLKRNILQCLVQNRPFVKLDRKLRSELISLDGACILNTAGDICAFGAIIKNNSGSSEGGRGAAAKKLSDYGMAIKISTDGYVELYIKSSVKYTIK